MRPRRTPSCNVVYELAGGNEDNSLWVNKTTMEETGEPVIASTWVPSEEERQQIAEGANVQLIVWGEAQPPVAVATTDEELGKG